MELLDVVWLDPMGPKQAAVTTVMSPGFQLSIVIGG
jgi:hypothetical protein